MIKIESASRHLPAAGFRRAARSPTAWRPPAPAAPRLRAAAVAAPRGPCQRAGSAALLQTYANTVKTHHNHGQITTCALFAPALRMCLARADKGTRSVGCLLGFSLEHLMADWRCGQHDRESLHMLRSTANSDARNGVMQCFMLLYHQ